jgi:hypothetical protein
MSVMGARIIYLAEVRARRSAQKFEPKVADTATHLTDRFHFWGGASGRRYVHTVYSLVECPEVPQGNFVLARREADGRRTVLAIGHLTRESPSLNLAELRQRGARLGANEVHIHLLAPSAQQRRRIELDLRAGQTGVGLTDRVAGTRH